MIPVTGIIEFSKYKNTEQLPGNKAVVPLINSKILGSLQLYGIFIFIVFERVLIMDCLYSLEFILMIL